MGELRFGRVPPPQFSDAARRSGRRRRHQLVAEHGDVARIRRQTVEHPFGTKTLDGSRTFFNSNVAARENRDELTCSSLQLETHDEDHRTSRG